MRTSALSLALRAGYEAPHSVPQPFPSVGPDGAEAKNTNSRQGTGRRKRLKERCNRMKMAKGVCGRRGEKRKKLWMGPERPRLEFPTHNWAREAVTTSTIPWFPDNLEHAYSFSLQ